MNIKVRLVFFFVLISFCVNSQNLVPYHKGDNWGFCTVEKKVIIKPSYERVESFKNGYALVVKNNKLGMINEKGEEIIPCLYKDLRHSSGGLLAAKDEKLMSGYLDSNNKIIISFQYEYASDYYEGEACVKLKSGDCFLIDKSGKKLTKSINWIKCTDKESIPEGINAKVFYKKKPDVKNSPSPKLGFSDFYYGLAYNEKSIVDSTGIIILESVSIYYASDRFVRVKYNDSTMRYYDLKRRNFFPGKFIWGSTISNGIAFATTDDGMEVSVNLLTGKKKELSELQKKLAKFRHDDAQAINWSKEQLVIHSKMRFRFLNDSIFFDKYYIVDNSGKPTGAIVHSFSKFLNSITDKNGNTKEELTFTYVSPDGFAYAITDSDTLIILNSTPILRDEKSGIKTDPVNKSVLYSDQCVVVDLDGNKRYEVNMDGAKAYDKKGNLINTFPCYTCDGEVKGIINHRISYDRELKMFLSSMGYISTDFKTAYFEE